VYFHLSPILVQYTYMHNWSVDEATFKKNYPQKYQLWRLIQLINYGLGGEKLNKQKVQRNWPHIKEHIDPYKARLIEYYLWGKQYSLPTNVTFWNWPAKDQK